jgi:hypothetical protein
VSGGVGAVDGLHVLGFAAEAVLGAKQRAQGRTGAAEHLGGVGEVGGHRRGVGEQPHAPTAHQRARVVEQALEPGAHRRAHVSGPWPASAARR